jgi:hypothetical protein
LPSSGDCDVPVTLGVELLRSGGAGVVDTEMLLALSALVSGGMVSVAGGWSTAAGRLLFVNVVLACAAVVLIALNKSTWFCCFLLFDADVELFPSSVPFRFSGC